MKIGPVMAKPQFFWPENARGDPSLKKMFFPDFDIIMGINATVLMHWFQNCIKFCCAVSVSEDIGKNMPKMLKLPILWFLAHYWQFFCQYICLGTFHRKTLYRSGISAQRRSNWYPWCQNQEKKIWEKGSSFAFFYQKNCGCVNTRQIFMIHTFS